MACPLPSCPGLVPRLGMIAKLCHVTLGRSLYLLASVPPCEGWYREMVPEAAISPPAWFPVVESGREHGRKKHPGRCQVSCCQVVPGPLAPLSEARHLPVVGCVGDTCPPLHLASVQRGSNLPTSCLCLATHTCWRAVDLPRCWLSLKCLSPSQPVSPPLQPLTSPSLTSNMLRRNKPNVFCSVTAISKWPLHRWFSVVGPP
jgi:hypothetical protein